MKGTKKKATEEDFKDNSKLEEQIASMLENEYGEDTDVLQLIEELEKTPEDESQEEAHAKDGENSDIRKCRNCGIEALFINGTCTECGHDLSEKDSEADEEESPGDESDFSGYNIDNDE